MVGDPSKMVCGRLPTLLRAVWLGASNYGKTVISKIHLVNLPEFQRFQEHLKLKGYSPNTLRTYSLEFAQLLYVLKSFPVQELSPERLRSYFPRYSGC